MSKLADELERAHRVGLCLDCHEDLRDTITRAVLALRAQGELREWLDARSKMQLLPGDEFGRGCLVTYGLVAKLLGDCPARIAAEGVKP